MIGLQELHSSEKQWVEVCGQIDKLDKFFPLGSLAMTKAQEAQAAAIARGMILLANSSFLCSPPLTGASDCGHQSTSCIPSGTTSLNLRPYCVFL